MIITIDGPAASGKSTVAAALAHKLSYIYLSSGLLYRALAYILLQRGYTQATIAEPSLKDVDVCLGLLSYHDTPDAGAVIIIKNQGNITAQLGTVEIDRAASVMSTNWYVRNVLDLMQRSIASVQNIVVDGRDAGSVVFPGADYKFFLTASAEIRAERWLARQKNSTLSLAQVTAMIKERDKRDTERAVSPLTVPLGATVIDSTNQTVAQVVDTLVTHIRQQECIALQKK